MNGIQREPEGETAKQTRTEEEEEKKLQKMGERKRYYNMVAAMRAVGLCEVFLSFFIVRFL